MISLDVFAEKRILIAATKLDDLKLLYSDNDESNADSNDEVTLTLEERIHSVKKIIKRQCNNLNVSIPDDCIIPLCATGALEARKEKLGGKRNKEMKKLLIELDVSTAEDLEEASQVSLLEEKLIEIAGNSHYLWHYNIVRDCTRYLDQ
ncbi:PREDICTED: uncharacterized protein LOC109592756, partial [Amphimedon queenslandica]|uniref:Uncharacterized protein n=2 Tax=Amphimedon queenslandica TaxID=400682 RepID=A0AAN0K2C1_AMPQE